MFSSPSIWEPQAVGMFRALEKTSRISHRCRCDWCTPFYQRQHKLVGCTIFIFPAGKKAWEWKQNDHNFWKLGISHNKQKFSIVKGWIENKKTETRREQEPQGERDGRDPAVLSWYPGDKTNRINPSLPSPGVNGGLVMLEGSRWIRGSEHLWLMGWQH